MRDVRANAGEDDLAEATAASQGSLK